MVARGEIDVVDVEKPNPVLPGQAGDGVAVVVAVREKGRALEAEIFVAGVEVSPQRYFIEVRRSGARRPGMLFRAPGREKERGFIQEDGKDAGEARRLLGLDFRGVIAVGQAPGDVPVGLPVGQPLVLAVAVIPCGRAGEPRHAAPAPPASRRIGAGVAESDHVPAVVRRHGEQVEVLPQPSFLEEGLLAFSHDIGQVVPGRSELVASRVVVGAVGIGLAEVEGEPVLIHERIQPGQAVLLRVVPVGEIQAEAHVRRMVLARFAGGRDVFIEEDHVADKRRVSPEDFLDHFPVGGREERVVVDEIPGLKEILQAEIDACPGFGNPVARFFGLLVGDGEAVAEMPGPFFIAGQEIVQAPGADLAIGGPRRLMLSRRSR